jgi:hypothetical protein
MAELQVGRVGQAVERARDRAGHVGDDDLRGADTAADEDAVTRRDDVGGPAERQDGDGRVGSLRGAGAHDPAGEAGQESGKDKGGFSHCRFPQLKDGAGQRGRQRRAHRWKGKPPCADPEW